MIVNDPFLSGIFSNKLKIAKVITLYKKDSGDNPTNYHPISLLSVFSKLIEKIMYKCLYSSCSILHLLQFGFRKKHSTLHVLIGITETIKDTFDNSMFLCGVFLKSNMAWIPSLICKNQYFCHCGIIVSCMAVKFCTSKVFRP